MVVGSGSGRGSGRGSGSGNGSSRGSTSGCGSGSRICSDSDNRGNLLGKKIIIENVIRDVVLFLDRYFSYCFKKIISVTCP